VVVKITALFKVDQLINLFNLLKTKIMKTGSLLFGFLCGTCIGGICGILFAPHKGSVTRKMITRRGEDYIDVLEEKFDDFLDTIDDKIDNVKKEVSGFVKKEKIKAHDINKHVKATLN
jgi:gas vesicle protein